jgi:hypothetical protein
MGLPLDLLKNKILLNNDSEDYTADKVAAHLLQPLFICHPLFV